MFFDARVDDVAYACAFSRLFPVTLLHTAAPVPLSVANTVQM